MRKKLSKKARTARFKEIMKELHSLWAEDFPDGFKYLPEYNAYKHWTGYVVSEEKVKRT